MIRFFTLTALLSWGMFFAASVPGVAAENSTSSTFSDSLEILYFANANALLENCHCGTPSLGGLARITTMIRQKRQKNPRLIFIDGGDFLNPYSYPELNRTVLQIYRILKPDIITLGDQEFVEGADFLKQSLADWKAVVASNFQLSGKTTARRRLIRFPGKTVTILSFLDKSAFDVIPFDKNSIRMEYSIFEKLYAESSRNTYLVVVYHGTGRSLQEFVKKHPKVDLVLAGHSQEEACRLQQQPVIVYGGVDTRYIFDIKIKFGKKENQVRCQPLPVGEDIRQDGRIVPLLKKFKAGR